MYGATVAARPPVQMLHCSTPYRQGCMRQVHGTQSTATWATIMSTPVTVTQLFLLACKISAVSSGMYVCRKNRAFIVWHPATRLASLTTSNTMGRCSATIFSGRMKHAVLGTVETTTSGTKGSCGGTGHDGGRASKGKRTVCYRSGHTTHANCAANAAA